MFSKGILSISEVNALTSEQFKWIFGNVVEHCPDAVQHVASVRPFTSAKALKKSFDDYLEKLDLSGKKNILLRYPDTLEEIVNGVFTTESQLDQDTVELKSMSLEGRQILCTYNNLYKEKFRFPFVICAHVYNISTIFKSIDIRLRNTRDHELHTGIQEVKKICNIKIDDLVWLDV